VYGNFRELLYHLTSLSLILIPFASSFQNVTTANKEFWRELIQLHRSLLELWKLKSDVYKNRKLKDAGYDELVEKPQENEDDADRDMVRKKINGLRTTYGRELKRITDSTKSGIGTDDIYVPSLW
jgi:hypothetical protein